MGDEAESAACPSDTSRLTPEVPTLPATAVVQLESRDLMFEFVETKSDFWRRCGWALVREGGVLVNAATYEVDETWWECWGRPLGMDPADDPGVEVFEDLQALDEGALIVGWAPHEIVEVTIRDGSDVLRFHVTTPAGRFATRLLARPEDWCLTVSSQSGETWSCAWVVHERAACP